MKLKTLCISLTALLTIISYCGKPPLEKGDEAFQQKNYSVALKNYLEAAKEMPEDENLREKIATCYFKQGQHIYNTRKVIKAFEARIEMGKKYLPTTLSKNMRIYLSQLYMELGLAYKAATPENRYQKKEYFDKTLANLDKAIQFDSTNTAAADTLQKFKEQHFQEMLDKGIRDYNRGRRDPINYISAEYYLNNALRFNPQSRQASRYLRLSRQRALNMLDPGQDVPFAITDQTTKEGYLAYMIVLQNLTGSTLSVNPDKFYLISENGEETKGETSEIFVGILPPVSLQNGEETSGVVAFRFESGKKYTRLEFRSDDKTLGFKNLP